MHNRLFVTILRGKAWFWLASGIVLLIVYCLVWSHTHSLFPEGQFEIKNGTIPVLILLWAIVSTTIYSWFFLLPPVMENRKEIFPRSATRAGTWFYLIYWTAVAVSIAIAGGYFIELFSLTRAIPDKNHTLASQSNFLFFLYETVKESHLLVFVFLWSSLDLLIYVKGKLKREKEFYGEILLVVDFPVLISMVFIEALVHFLRQDLGDAGTVLLEFLQAGVVSFQLLAGGLAICVMEAIRDAKSGGIDASHVIEQT
ncbi:hypothetical protein [Bradyrhizobium genosp. A]|uniref:hypothetical protein n=1 Tax=Bradyrhizobium genosp. A TaxID=83626 RepID=UPI003CE7D629